MTESLSKLKLIEGNCSSTVENFFSRKSCFGDKDSSYCKDSFVNDGGPLKCLKEFGDVAFMNLETFKNLTRKFSKLKYFIFELIFYFIISTVNSTQFSPKMFSVLCPFKKSNNYFRETDTCYLSWTSKGILMTNKDKSQMRMNEIVNSLKTMDNHFGKRKFRSGNIPFTMFGPFDQKTNVLFKDSTDELKTKYELNKITNYERNLESYLSSALVSQQYCSSSKSLAKLYNHNIYLALSVALSFYIIR